MKNLSIILCAYFFLISAQSIFAQNEGPGTLVFSQNMVAMKDMGKVNKLIDSLSVPIWNEIMNEGMLTKNHSLLPGMNLSNVWVSGIQMPGKK